MDFQQQNNKQHVPQDQKPSSSTLNKQHEENQFGELKMGVTSVRHHKCLFNFFEKI